MSRRFDFENPIEPVFSADQPIPTRRNPPKPAGAPASDSEWFLLRLGGLGGGNNTRLHGIGLMIKTNRKRERGEEEEGIIAGGYAATQNVRGGGTISGAARVWARREPATLVPHRLL